MRLLPDEQICWQAVSQNDATYDGVFVYAVTTTGIFCHPSCASRQPKRDHVRFFTEPAQAQSAGFRPCKRCQPTAIQIAPQVELVLLACATIAEQPAERLTLTELGTATHTSPTHLQRVFKLVMGISPRQYADALRANEFKQALRAGYTVTDSAGLAGYTSSSRAHAHAETHLGMTPSTYQAGGKDMTIYYGYAPCSLGVVLAAMTERGVCSIEMGDTADEVIANLQDEFPQATLHHDQTVVETALQSVLDYLEGHTPHIDLPLDIRMTAFQQSVLTEMSRIPYGETRTYRELAVAVGNPKAARAVGQVCNKNPVPIVIPCHRVVRSDGKIEGYAFGTERKKVLLDMERAHVNQFQEEPVE